MQKVQPGNVFVLVAVATIVAAGVVLAQQQQQSPAPTEPASSEPAASREHALKSITMNTQAYEVPPQWQRDTRSVQITAKEDMHIVALEHFIGVQGGQFGDNGHIFSTSPDNPWVKWEQAGTGMEPNGTEGYFGYCGRDYYSECAGIQDVMAYQTFPAGTHVLIPSGETLYLHCYAALQGGQAHHMVRILYW
jgi:hypothetical protein